MISNRIAPASLLLYFILVSIASKAAPESATVSIALDHNRIIIPISVYLPGGKIKRVNAWVDNGTPTSSITKKLAAELGLRSVQSNDPGDGPMVQSPGEVMIGRMQIHLSGSVEAEDSPTVAGGVNAEISLSATDLHNYDVVVDYPHKQFTIAATGKARFKGQAVKGFFNPHNYLIQLPAEVDKQRFNLALDMGTPVTFISPALVKKWAATHPSYPSVTGAIGIANLWGLDDEPDWQLLRLPAMRFGNSEFRDPIVVSFPANRLDYFKKRAGISTEGLFGAASLLNYAVGIDYRNKTVYLEKEVPAIHFKMNLVGIILRPEGNGNYTILGVADKNRQPVVRGIKKGDILKKVNGQIVTAMTMGDVWALLQGKPGEVKTLIVDRDGKQLTITVKVETFLASTD